LQRDSMQNHHTRSTPALPYPITMILSAPIYPTQWHLLIYIYIYIYMYKYI
jgi:hypothetical protein